MPATHTPRTISGLAGGAIRRATYNGVEHIVVPVVCALGNMVVWPLNATGWELVPEEELAAYPTGWNGRPILPDHPHGGTLSANDPDTLARLQFGTMFATRYANGALQTEAWLNPLRAKEVGPAAESVIERVLAGELVEVSVGAGIITDPTPGVTSDGREYSAIWRDIIPDHLAMLPRGAEGACSIEMGCGAPRQLALSAMSQLREAEMAVLSAVNTQANPSTEEHMEPETSTPTTASASPTRQSVLSRLWQSLTSAIRVAQGDATGFSDSDLRMRLRDALRAIEPGFSAYYYDDGIYEVYTDTSTVVYCTYPGDELLIFQRTYNLAADGSVTVNDDRQQVEPAVVYKVVGEDSTAETPSMSVATGARHSAGDMKMIQDIHQTAVDLGATCPTSTDVTTTAAAACGCKGDDMNKEAIKAAVARLHRGAATDEDKALLTTELGMTAEELAPAAPAPSSTATAPTATAQPAPVAASTGNANIAVTPTAAAAPKSPEDLEREWLATSPPPHLVAMADRFKAEEAARRAQLVAAISGATSAFTAEELAAMPTSGGPGSLERTYVALGLGATAFPGSGPSFLGRPFPAPAPGTGSVEVKRRRYEGPMAAAARKQAGGAAPTVAADPDDVAN